MGRRTNIDAGVDRDPASPARLCKFPDLDYPSFSGSFSTIVSSAVSDLTSFSCPTCST